MSRFLSDRFSELTAYVPGEQPRDQQYIKLNTNESPFPPSPAVKEAAAAEAEKLNLYNDPECTLLKEKMAALYGISPKNVLPVNGSDEVLYLAVKAFCDEKTPLAYPSISYGFYSVFASVNRVPGCPIPLTEDFSVDPEDYKGIHKTVVIANPNAPTGKKIPLSEVEAIVKSNPDNVVIIDEAYVDFGGESAVPLIAKYENLLVTQTFSKSRSLAGARLGFGFASETIINDLNTMKYSLNPYNVNRMTQAAGVAALESNDYYMENCRRIMATRENTAAKLRELGFDVLPSFTNFLFARHASLKGRELYLALRDRGVLVRQFQQDRIEDYLRITIGTDAQMDVFFEKLIEIMKEKGC